MNRRNLLWSALALPLAAAPTLARAPCPGEARRPNGEAIPDIHRMCADQQHSDIIEEHNNP